MKSLIVKLVIAAVLFAGSLACGLAATGRLNHAGTANIPLLARLFPAPGKPGPEATAPMGETAAPGHGGEAGSAADASPSQRPQDPEAAPRKQKTGRSVVHPETTREVERGVQAPGKKPSASAAEDRGKQAGDAKATPAEAGRDAGQPQHPSGEPESKYVPGKYFKFEGVPAPLTPEQINEAWQRVQGELEDIERRKSVLDLREKELQEFADDVGRRQKELGHERTKIAEEHQRLDARIRKFEDQVKLVRYDEASALRRNATTLSELESNKAAELISEQWKTDPGQNEVLKLLEFMDEDALVAILDVLPTAMVQDLLSKRLRVRREAAPAGSRK